MNIYQIDAQIRQAEEDLLNTVDFETGEITDEYTANEIKAKLDALEIDRKKKIEGACFLRKEALDTISILSDEIKRLQGLKKREERREASLKNYIGYATNGEKFKTPFVSVYSKSSESVKITDSSKLSDSYMRVKKEPDKEKIKKFIKGGGTVPGAELETTISTVISYGKADGEA